MQQPSTQSHSRTLLIAIGRRLSGLFSRETVIRAEQGQVLRDLVDLLQEVLERLGLLGQQLDQTTAQLTDLTAQLRELGAQVQVLALRVDRLEARD